jgi:integrase
MEITEAVEAYYSFLVKRLKVADSTAKGRTQEARKLAEFLSADDLFDARGLTAERVEEFVFCPRYMGLADKTYNVYLSHLRQFITFLREERLLGDDISPERFLVPRRKPRAKREQARIKADEIADIAEKGMVWHPRDKYFILASYYMARRAGELCTMRWADIDLIPSPRYKFGRFLFTNHKTHSDAKHRPLRREIQEALIEWKALYAELIGRKVKPTDFVFPVLKGGGGARWKGYRRSLTMHPGSQLPYESTRDIMYRVGVKGTHAGRRGGLDEVAERWGITYAKTLADHASEVTTELYLNRSREVDALADVFAEEPPEAAEQAPAPVMSLAEHQGVASLSERRARRLRGA